MKLLLKGTWIWNVVSSGGNESLNVASTTTKPESNSADSWPEKETLVVVSSFYRRKVNWISKMKTRKPIAGKKCYISLTIKHQEWDH